MNARTGGKIAGKMAGMIIVTGTMDVLAASMENDTSFLTQRAQNGKSPAQ